MRDSGVAALSSLQCMCEINIVALINTRFISDIISFQIILTSDFSAHVNIVRIVTKIFFFAMTYLIYIC